MPAERASRSSIDRRYLSSRYFVSIRAVIEENASCAWNVLAFRHLPSSGHEQTPVTRAEMAAARQPLSPSRNSKVYWQCCKCCVAGSPCPCNLSLAISVYTGLHFLCFGIAQLRHRVRRCRPECGVWEWDYRLESESHATLPFFLAHGTKVLEIHTDGFSFVTLSLSQSVSVEFRSYLYVVQCLRHGYCMSTMMSSDTSLILFSAVFCCSCLSCVAQRR